VALRSCWEERGAVRVTAYEIPAVM